ncbi:nuclear pore complex protein NUP50A-like [Cornus florida]|uniref:nuclear pore complex protein NUP50A-like n=1 Tax=Cornus florida TaxID=4283 RepID=UPI00289AD08C|nr:nuclear pore complex protein NUP50A-like [Cornus florida]XP_059638520.1 nuclear pore complex protein NUP50A-like [Cornus florida]XP_059638521.1 nuclear pore complex protein NUP50A-like [Cornus florida]
MGDAEDAFPPSKKRAAGRQLSRENPGLDDEEEASEQETGSFKRANDEVLANRKFVKVCRHQTSAAPSVPSSNPFAGIRLVPPPISSATSVLTTEAKSEKTVAGDVDGKYDVNEEPGKEKDENDKSSENKVDEAGAKSTQYEEKTEAVDETTKPYLADVKATEGDKTQNGNCDIAEGVKTEDKNDDCNGNIVKVAETASLNSFQQLSSSRNAFTGLAGTGISNSTFSSGSIPRDGSPLGSGSLVGLNDDQSSCPFFGSGLSNNGSSSLFGMPGVAIGTRSEGSRFPSLQEVPVETGEEYEKAVFTSDSALFEYLDGGWKERGKGELKVNVSTTGTGKARLVMRARGNYRLILNASLYTDMKLTNMEKRGVTFACMNSTGEGKDGLSTFALKFKDASIVEEFFAAVAENKGKTAAVLKTPENSPKASDD